MASRPTTLTAAAGEHYVAFKLSALGLPVALTRGGSPTVDLMVGDLTGRATISLQIKTSSNAWRPHKSNADMRHWEWDVGGKALTLVGGSIYYAFVDLRGDESLVPDVFVVPSPDVAERLKDATSNRYMYWLFEREAKEYKDRWDRILSVLNPSARPI